MGKARQLGCPKIVLDHVGVYIYVTRSEKKALWVQFTKIELSLSFNRAIFDLPNATYSKLISHSYQEL